MLNQEETNTPHDITYMWSLEYNRNEPIYETETDSQVQRTDMWLPRRLGVEDGWFGSLALAEANYYMMDKQQSPTV